MIHNKKNHLKKNYLDCKTCETRFESVFCDLNEDEIAEVNRSKGCLHFNRGQQIFHEHAFPQGLFAIQTGKVKISQLGDMGREQIIHLARDGDLLGTQDLLCSETYSCSATAIDDCLVCFVPRQTFMKILGQNSKFALRMMQYLAADLKKAEHMITSLAQKHVRERAAEILLNLLDQYGVEADRMTLNVSLRQEELANLIGIARETATRVLSGLQEDGVIELKGRKVLILNREKLSMIADASVCVK